LFKKTDEWNWIEGGWLGL